MVSLLGLSSFASMQRAQRKVLRYVHSRPFEVIEIDTARKPICDFLLVFHCNCMPIFYYFRDLTIYWSKFYVFCRFYTSQYRLKRLLECTVKSWELGIKVGLEN